MGIIIFVDPGHGISTENKQKFSPKLTADMGIPTEFISGGRFRECRFNRVVAEDLVDTLVGMGYDARLTVTEKDGNTDVSLSERCNRVNRVCKQVGANKVIFVSIHANANGDGNKWDTANGWEVWTSPGTTKSDAFATKIFERAKKNFTGRKMRSDYSDGDPDKESKFYVLVHTNCPAILTENFFYTNKEELKYLTSNEGMYRIQRTHIEGIIDFINYLGGRKK